MVLDIPYMVVACHVNNTVLHLDYILNRILAVLDSVQCVAVLLVQLALIVFLLVVVVALVHLLVAVDHIDHLVLAVLVDSTMDSADMLVDFGKL